MKKFHGQTAALAILPTAVISLSFVPGFQAWAPVLWAVGLAGMVVALVFVSSRRHVTAGGSDTRQPKRRIYALSAVVAAGALVGSLLVSDSEAQAATSASLPLVSESSNVSPGVLRQRLSAATSDISRIRGAKASTLIAAARALGTEPASGLRADYANARVFVDGANEIVSVPLLGTDLPEVTHLTFITSAGVTQVTEMVADLISPERVHLGIWQNGIQAKNVELSSAAPGAQAEVGTKGFSMDKLKKCFNNAGLNWALIAVVGAACGVACATAVLCAPCVALNAGLTGDTVTKCVKIAFS
jgi:hypothetical protein